MQAKALLNLVGDRLHTLPLVVLYLTDGCNSRCVTCDIWRNPRRNMPMELIEKIALDCAGLNTRWLLLSGGEAMQHPHWPQIAQRFRAFGMHVMLLTNGLLLHKQVEDVLASVDEVIVSLDGGTASTYHAIRGVDGFDLVMSGIQAVRAGGLPVTTRTTVQRANFREIPQIIEAARQAGASRVSFLPVDVSNPFAFGPRFAADPDLIVQGSGGIPDSALTAQDIAELAAIVDALEVHFAADFASGLIAETASKLRRILVDHFMGIAGHGHFTPPRCNAPHFSTVIEVDGTLRPCYFLPAYGRLEAGGMSLRQAVNVRAALALRQAYRTGERPECARCVCPLYKGPRALLKM